MNILVINNDVRDQRLLHRTLLCLKAAGHRSFVITSPSRNFTPIRFSHHKRQWINHDAKTLNSSVINQYCNRWNIDIIVPTDIASTFLLSEIRHEITETRVFPLMSSDVLHLLHNKWRFMQWLNEHQLPCPETQLISAESDFEDLLCEYPIIAKPLEEEGGRGVRKINSRDELNAYRNDQHAKSQYPILIQKFIAGRDLVFGVLAEKGQLRAWTIQMYNDDRVDFIDHPELLERGKQILQTLNYTGIAEFDVRLDEAGSVKFIECNPRIWASVTISMCMSVNFIHCGILMTQGCPFPMMQSPAGCYIDPTLAIKQLLRRPSRYAELSKASRHAIFLRLSDPLPTLYDAWQILFRNHENERL